MNLMTFLKNLLTKIGTGHIRKRCTVSSFLTKRILYSAYYIVGNKV